jgi:hypothetical protein
MSVITPPAVNVTLADPFTTNEFPPLVIEFVALYPADPELTVAGPTTKSVCA